MPLLEEVQDQIKADRLAGMTYKQLSEKYTKSYRDIQKVVEPKYQKHELPTFKNCEINLIVMLRKHGLTIAKLCKNFKTTRAHIQKILEDPKSFKRADPVDDEEEPAIVQEDDF